MKAEKGLILALCLAMMAASTIVDAKGHSRQSQPGTIRGTVVYTFNNEVGSKPDTGTAVLLVVGKLVIQRDNFSSGTTDGRLAVIKNGKQSLFLDPPENPKFSYYKLAGRTIVDGNGNYSILQVKPGTYTIVLYSKHTHHIMLGGLSARDLVNRVGQRIVTVKPGQTIDGSHDFQMDTELSYDEQELALKGLNLLMAVLSE